MDAIEFFSFIFGFISWSFFYGDHLLWVTISPALKVVAREKIDCINQQLEVSPHYKFTPDHLCELTPVLKKSLPLESFSSFHNSRKDSVEIIQYPSTWTLCNGATDKELSQTELWFEHFKSCHSALRRSKTNEYRFDIWRRFSMGFRFGLILELTSEREVS